MKPSPLSFPVYVSYSWKENSSNDSISDLNEVFLKTRFDLFVDKHKVTKQGDDFMDFIAEIGKADCIIVIVSKSYTESFYCMLEYSLILKHGNKKDRIIFLKSGDDNLSKLGGLKEIWKNNLRDYNNGKYDVKQEERLRHYIGKEPTKKEYLKNLQGIINSCDDLLSTFTEILDGIDNIIKNVNGIYANTVIKYNGKHPLYKQLNNILSINHGKDKNLISHLKNKIDDKELSNNKIITRLLLYPLNELFDTMIEIKESTPVSFSFFQHILPLYVPKRWRKSFHELIASRNEEKSKVMTIDCSTAAYVEIAMASIQKRKAELIPIKITSDDDKDDNKCFLPKKKYWLANPAEGGNTKSCMNETEIDILARDGNLIDNFATAHINTENIILSRFGYTPLRIKHMPNDKKKEAKDNWFENNPDVMYAIYEKTYYESGNDIIAEKLANYLYNMSENIYVLLIDDTDRHSEETSLYPLTKFIDHA